MDMASPALAVEINAQLVPFLISTLKRKQLAYATKQFMQSEEDLKFAVIAGKRIGMDFR